MAAGTIDGVLLLRLPLDARAVLVQNIHGFPIDPDLPTAAVECFGEPVDECRAIELEADLGTLIVCVADSTAERMVEAPGLDPSGPDR